MYCVNCGKKLEENQKFCSACGQPVVGIKQTENNPQNQYGIENNEFRKRQEDHKQYITTNKSISNRRIWNSIFCNDNNT